MKKLQAVKKALPGTLLFVVGILLVIGALALSDWVGDTVGEATNEGWGTLADFLTYWSLAFVYFFGWELVKVRLEENRWAPKEALVSAGKRFWSLTKFMLAVLAIIAVVAGIFYLGFLVFITFGLSVLLLSVLTVVAIGIFIVIFLIFWLEVL